MFSCSPGKGENMSMETFRKALSVAVEHDSMIAIGGGEPTLHPDILAFLGMAAFLTPEPVFMVTNGTCPRDLWGLLMMARDSKRLDIHVSRSPWHDSSKVRPWVEAAADRYNLWWGRPERRTIVLRGRARRNRAMIEMDCRRRGVEVEFIESDCSEPRVSPDGRVWADIPGGGAMGMVEDPVAVSRAFDAIGEYENRDFQ